SDRHQRVKTPANLPDPSPDELAASAALTARIAGEIAAAGGAISFERYMELALYAPGLGYYVGGARKFGADGDFVTAPEISSLFGAALARPCAEILERVGGEGAILEFGGGTGRLAADVLAALAGLGRL